MEQLKTWFTKQEPQFKRKLFLLVGLIVAIAGVYFSQNSQPIVNEAESSTAYFQAPSGSIFIHVVGEVNTPGLYELKVGSRVQDALDLAGGMTELAVQSSVNLARMLSDGEQIVVLSSDQLSNSAEGIGYISLNRASQDQLESLSGVGPALAGRILEYRKSHGSFSDLSELREVSGIGAKLFESISKQLTL